MSEPATNQELEKKKTSLNIAKEAAAQKNPSNAFQILLCDCEQCIALRTIRITPSTVFKIEFNFKNIDSDCFSEAMQNHCRSNAVDGYIIFNNKGDVAHGVMEGSTRDMNVVMDWIKQKGDKYIERPLEENVKFSWIMIATEPTKLRFAELDEVPIVSSAADSSREDLH
ncbi:hypothetical protein KR044_012402 [Drosophila immigrans]|nr:hypothetical protein KR044_012402 [Drosophila immigrans]